MKTRKLGNSNLEVSALGLGCMRMSFGDTPTDKQEMIALLHKLRYSQRQSPFYARGDQSQPGGG